MRRLATVWPTFRHACQCSWPSAYPVLLFHLDVSRGLVGTDGDIVTAIRDLAIRGVGSKTIAREIGVSRNTVRRYLREPLAAGVQVRPAARKLAEADRRTARELYTGGAAGNAVVVRRLLAERGVVVSELTIQRAVADLRREQRVVRWRPFASKHHRAISSESISVRSRSSSRVRAFAFFCSCRAQLLRPAFRQTVSQ
jgi:hypothetical protein